MRPWILRRELFGNYDNLMVELARESQGDFTNYMRMEPCMFRELLDRIGPRVQKQNTHLRPALPPGLKLAITLRYIASGDSYHSLSYSFRVPHNTISLIVKEVSEAIVAELEPEVFNFPTSQQQWLDVAENFENRWNFPHTCGAIDGKHIAIKAPSNSGTLYHNYKGFFSIILLALVDADYKFMYANVGANGSTSDCAVFNVSPLLAALESGQIGFPDPQPLPHDDMDTKYFLIGDDAFPLRTWMMKPFSQRNLKKEERIFNYRLSRARRIVENAFGILANRFRCLLSTMMQEPETVKTIVTAALCLYNLMRIRYPGLQNLDMDHEGPNHEIIPGAWRLDAVLQDVHGVVRGNVATRQGKQQRIYLKHYYNTVGSVDWQDHMI